MMLHETRSDVTTPPYRLGFTSLTHEGRLEALPVRGQLPQWLTGTLIRNGPAQFEVGPQPYRHWFDGLAMLHTFAFQGGRVAYTNRFLESTAFCDAQAHGTITQAEFATDPCRSLFARVKALFFPRVPDNACVSIDLLAHRYVALTDAPLPIAFDRATLHAVGVVQPVDAPPGQLSTAHPHWDFDRQLSISYRTQLARQSVYHVFATDPAGCAHQMGAVRVDQPAYMHSFGMTTRYVVLAEFPLVVRPLRLLLRGKPFIENFRWQPERGTRFWVLTKADGRLVGTYQTEACFAFHHVNAFERGDEVVVDLSAYADPAIIDAFYLDKLRSGMVLPQGQLRRYRFRLGTGDGTCDVVWPQTVEFPRINYRQCNGRAYRYVFGAGSRESGNFLDQLVKVDVHTGTATTWYEPGCYPGEPVFVAAPGAAREDEGVILSVVLDAPSGTAFLLVLDADSWEERARARVPHHIPFGLHGQYFGPEDVDQRQHLHR